MYILGSHNSWSYAKPRKWWMKLIRFTAKCQDYDIYSQYRDYGVRCFDLRVRYDGNELVVAHGIIEYKISETEVYSCLEWFDKCGDVCVRLIHEVRSEKERTEERVNKFKEFCSRVEKRYPSVKFWCGMNLLPQQTVEYDFEYKPTCEELYASVCPPKLIDDWYPRHYAKKHNHENREKGTDKDILLIDFVDYK